MSTVVWNSLTTQEQQWLQEAVDESVEHQKILWRQASAEALAEVEKAGVKIIIPDKEPFRKAVTSMHDSFKGTAIYNLIAEIKGVRQ